MSRTIDVTLRLSDLLSASLRRSVNQASGLLDGLQSKMNGASQSSVGGAIDARMIAAGNLLSSGIIGVANGVVGAGQALVSSFHDALRNADQANSESLSSTSSSAALLNISFKESAKLTKEVTQTLAKSAEFLPGATGDYTQAYGGLSDSLAMSGGLTKDGLTEAGRNVTEFTAMMGQANRMGSQATSTAIGKLLGSESSDSIFRSDIFENVPTFKAILDKTMAAMGKTTKDFHKMDAKAKLDIISSVADLQFSDEYIAEMNKAVSSQMSTQTAKLFDPHTGIFGFMRSIKLDGIETNVFDELGKTFASFTKAATSILSIFPPGEDPMVALASALKQLRNYLASVTSTIKSISTGQMSIGVWLAETWDLIASSISGKLSELGTNIMNMAFSGKLGSVGFRLGDQLADGLVWAFEQTTQFIISNFPAITGVIFGAFVGLAQLVSGVIFGLATNIPDLFVAGLTASFTILVTTITSTLAAITGVAVGLFSQIGNVLNSGFQSMVGVIGSGFNIAINAARSIGSSIAGLINQLLDAIKTSIQSALSSITSIRLPNPMGSSGSVPSRHLGQNLGWVGSAAKGNLLSAIQDERKNMPSGSNIVIANSSELIVPQNRMGDLNSSINITINAKRDQIVSQVTNALNSVLRQPPIFAS